MTADLQPLDYKVNGAFKNKMKYSWFKNGYNEDYEHVEKNMCRTILEPFDSLSPQLIKDSFACMY
jgi:hypothetical protein